jgi:hypothetical protein
LKCKLGDKFKVHAPPDHLMALASPCCRKSVFITIQLTFWNKPFVCGVTLIRKRGAYAGAVLKFGFGTDILRALWAPRGR